MPERTKIRSGLSEVWIRFLVAIVGLTVAFGAALFSTVTRESGHLWATLILSSIALVLATLVGVTTVPYLTQRVAAARVREALDYEVTRAGMVYAALVIVIGVAALNTGNNLLYIIVAAMLAAIIVSGIASAIVLRDLQLEVRLPEHVFAGRTTTGKFEVRNPRKRLPSFSVSVVSLQKNKSEKHWSLERTAFGFPPGRPEKDQWLRTPDWRVRRIAAKPPAADIFQGAAYFPYIPPKSEQRADLQLCFEKRGLYQQDSFGLRTRFPFAFLSKTRRVPLQREITVFPRIEPTDQFFQILPLITGEMESFLRGRGHDLYRIREYTSEDSARHVDWKATAKSGMLKVREFTREDERKLRIVFDNPSAGQVSEKQYEDALGLAASLAWHFAGENADLSFAAQGYSGAPDVYRFLTHLAGLQPEAGASIVDDLPLTGDYNIILTTRPRGTIPTTLWATSYFVFMGV
ncbi:MAG TPA: DUF58 domain-containing protein [Terriglobales bacterium]|jgi:uncharacterized protein (DUF58 family)|nr:DUF58 domain-containing protein [Terriglobales bacterium]